jgi:phosphoribosylglycinamide formyltransferase-1
MLSLGVLCSGSGTNLQAILDACASGELDARVALVLCNKPGVAALERAERAGVPSRVMPHRDAPSREAYDAGVAAALREAGVELVVLAGFMRLVTPVLLGAFPDRVINIHPALLPSFPGLDGQQQALAHGVAVTGCTVHLVDAGMDTGPILAQAAVPVLDGDDRDALARRVLRQEHRLLVEVIRWFAEGRVRVERAEGQRPRARVDGRRRAFWSDEP